MKEITNSLSMIVKKHGAKLYKEENDDRIKFVLENDRPLDRQGKLLAPYRAFCYSDKHTPQTNLNHLEESYMTTFGLNIHFGKP